MSTNIYGQIFFRTHAELFAECQRRAVLFNAPDISLAARQICDAVYATAGAQNHAFSQDWGPIFQEAAPVIETPTPRKIDLETPQAVVRWENGKRKSTTAAPEPFNSDRAHEILVHARRHQPFVDAIQRYMTDGEVAYVKAVWDTCNMEASWLDAFRIIENGIV